MVTFYGIDQVYVYLFIYFILFFLEGYDFVSFKKGQILIHVDIFNKIFHIIYIGKAFSCVSESYILYEKVFTRLEILSCYTLRLLFLIAYKGWFGLVWFGLFGFMAYQPL